MKKAGILLFYIFLSGSSFSQDLFDFYRDFSEPGPYYRDDQIMDTYFEGRSIFQSYQGEYVIYANDLPWIPYMLRNSSGNIDLTQFLLTYQFEVVSFPFMPANSFSGAADGLSVRNLFLPTVPLEPNGRKWICSSDPTNATDLWNKTLEFPFEYSSTGDVYASQSHPNTLVSAAFGNVDGFNLNRIVLPHTVLKHTIKLHCGTSISDPVLSSIVFYNDLTRGTMREYPFNNSNVPQAQQFHDVTILPRIITSGSSLGSTYGKTAQCDFENPYPGFNTLCDGDMLIDTKANTLNYTPFNLIDDDFCNLVPVANQVNSYTDFSFYGLGSDAYTEHLPLPNYALVNSTGTKNIYGELPAGYLGVNASNTLDRLASVPVVHQYNIDQNILLDQINQADKVIFNPSEAWVSADNLHFPTNYTFKTIRAIYPYLQDVENENTPENGGPYNSTDPFDPNYLTNLNVTTDLFKDFHVSNPAYPDNEHNYASIYHLVNGSKIIVEPCVRIFDATFEVSQGSEIVFENWSTNQVNVARYNLLYEGGTVTKCNEDFFFQNKNESERILKWKAGNSIRAGENVDLSSNSGVYKIVSGSEVAFIANNFISLETGFDSETGSFLDALIEPVTIPTCGPLRLGRRDVNATNSSSNLDVLSYFECSPNPINENSICMFKIGNTSNVTLQVYNSLGQLIATICEAKQLPAGAYTYNLNLNDFKPGIYYAKLNVNNDSKSLKFVKT